MLYSVRIYDREIHNMCWEGRVSVDSGFTIKIQDALSIIFIEIKTMIKGLSFSFMN